MSSEFVKNIIKSSPNKSYTLDSLSTHILNLTLDNVVDCITDIINESLVTGIVPSCFKNVIVTLLIKKQNLNQNVLLARFTITKENSITMSARLL